MNTLKIGLLSGLGVLMVGCASHSDLATVKTEALESSSEANVKADEAMTTAREAKQIAQEANARSLRSEEMLNRGFKKSMYK